MKAILCESLGLPSQLVYKEVPDLTPSKNEVLIKVKTCAVNFPDTLIIQGKYQFKPDLPFSPGSDIAGIVQAVGPEVKNYKEGDEVFGVTRYGGMAEQILVQESNVFLKPQGMDYKIATSFLYAYGTSLHALKDRAQVKEGETVVIMGAAGGVGLAAVDLAKRLGARVIACCSTQAKLDLCQSYGADEMINYSTADLKSRIKELTGGKGADVIYDPVGSHYTEPALRGMAWGGRYLVVGFAAGEIPKIPLNLALLKGCSIVGVFWGRFAQEEPHNNMANSLQILEWFSKGEIKPHIHKVFSLEQAPLAIQELMDRKVLGKVLIEI